MATGDHARLTAHPIVITPRTCWMALAAAVAILAAVAWAAPVATRMLLGGVVLALMPA